MYSIGDLARLGGVSVRMLRHYDEIGLLRPARVDERTAYRSYESSQVHRLRRIVTLRELGFSLAQIAALLEEDVSTEQLRGMLRMRRAQLHDEQAANQLRIDRITDLITQLETKAPPMSAALNDTHVTRRPIAAHTVAECSVTIGGFDSAAIGAALPPLYPQVFGALGRAGVSPVGPALAFYTDRSDGGVGVHAGVPIDVSDATRLAASTTAVQVRELPQIDAVCTLHRGSPASIGATYDALLAWISEHGLATDGYSREISLECPADMNLWVTEIQFAVVPAG